MQTLRRHSRITLSLLSFLIILAILLAFFLQNNPKQSSLNPSSTPSSSPSPSKNSPSPKVTINATPTATPFSSSKPISTPFIFPGEVTQHDGHNLTPVIAYINSITAHPDVAIMGTQNLDKATYYLAITGMVSNPINYTYNEIVENFNSTLDVATLPCVEGWGATLLWQGVPIKDILNQTLVSPNATTLIFLASDGYTTSLPLNYVIQNNIAIAYKMNNLTLTAQTGWPFFLVAKNQYGYKWIEWLTEINVSNDSSYLGYWESRGYPNNATVLEFVSTSKLPYNSPIILLVVTFSTTCVGSALFVLLYRFNAKKHKFERLKSI